MAALKKVKFGDRVRDILLDGLKAQAIDAKVEFEPIRTTRLHRFMVTAPKFKKLRPRERQELVWHIVSNKLPDDEQLCISMIMTLTPDELGGND